MRSTKSFGVWLLFSTLVLGPIGLRADGAKEFDEPPVPVKSVPPDYPVEMKRAGVSGLVTVMVIINENGEVLERVVSKSTRTEFEAAALDAVAKWKFRPARKGGENVKARVNIPIKFAAE